MANELIFGGASGQTLYYVLLNATSQFFNTVTPGFEAFNGANYANYDNALTEQGTTGIYLGTPPSIVLGTYRFLVKQQVGASPAQGDPIIGGGSFEWTSTALVNFPANWNSLVIDASGNVAADVVEISGDSAAADRLEALFEGAVIPGSVNDAGATTTVFIAAAGLSAVDDYYNGMALSFTNGTLAGQTRKVTDYAGATRTFTFAQAFTSAPANGATFVLLGRIE
jgi:hypothetical protein